MSNHLFHDSANSRLHDAINKRLSENKPKYADYPVTKEKPKDDKYIVIVWDNSNAK